jgi:hypothetical protein
MISGPFAAGAQTTNPLAKNRALRRALLVSAKVTI